MIVLSARIDAGTAHYISCAGHVPVLGHRLIEDAGRAVANLLAASTRSRRDAIDVEEADLTSGSRDPEVRNPGHVHRIRTEVLGP